MLLNKQWIYTNTYVLLRTLLSDVIFYFGFVSNLDLIMLTILHLHYISNIIPTYFRSVTILARFITFNYLVHSSLDLIYTCQASPPKALY